MSDSREVVWERTAPETEPQEPLSDKRTRVMSEKIVRRLSENEQKTFDTYLNYKNCHLGMATDMTWSQAYCTMQDGMLKLYNSKTNGEISFFEVALDSNHRASPWQHKKWAKTDENGQDEHISFYIEEATPIIGWIKIVKFGFFDVPTAERVLRCIETNTGNTTREVIFGEKY